MSEDTDMFIKQRFVLNRMKFDMVFWESGIYVIFIEFSLWY